VCARVCNILPDIPQFTHLPVVTQHTHSLSYNKRLYTQSVRILLYGRTRCRCCYCCRRSDAGGGGDTDNGGAGLYYKMHREKIINFKNYFRYKPRADTTFSNSINDFPDGNISSFLACLNRYVEKCTTRGYDVSAAECIIIIIMRVYTTRVVFRRDRQRNRFYYVFEIILAVRNFDQIAFGKHGTSTFRKKHETVCTGGRYGGHGGCRQFCGGNKLLDSSIPSGERRWWKQVAAGERRRCI